MSGTGTLKTAQLKALQLPGTKWYIIKYVYVYGSLNRYGYQSSLGYQKMLYLYVVVTIFSFDNTT